MGILSLEIRIYWLHGVETDRNWIQTCGFQLYLCFRYTHFHASKWYSIGKISLIKFQRPYQAQYHITLTYCLQFLVSLSDMCNLWLAGKNTTTYTVVDYERIAVLEGDVIGWYSWIFIFKYLQIWIYDYCILCTIHFAPSLLRRSKGDNLITSGTCLGRCAAGYMASRNNVRVGGVFDFVNSGSLINGTAYAIKACLEDSEIEFHTLTISGLII